MSRMASAMPRPARRMGTSPSASAICWPGHSARGVRTVSAASRRSCDGLTRREALRVGGLGFTGLLWSDWLRARAAAAAQARTARRPAAGGFGRARACILVYNYGGPSHLDTWDLKPDAPREIRGEFRPIATSTPGVRVCEHLPHCARVMHKLAVVRSLHHPMRNHNAAAVEALCGRTPLRGDLELLADDANDFPCYGAVVSQQRTGPPGVLAHVALPHVMHNVVKLPGQSARVLGAGCE